MGSIFESYICVFQRLQLCVKFDIYVCLEWASPCPEDYSLRGSTHYENNLPLGSIVIILCSSNFRKHHYSKTIKARELIFRENIQHSLHVTSCVAHVPCHTSGVMCHVSYVTRKFFLSLQRATIQVITSGREEKCLKS